MASIEFGDSSDTVKIRLLPGETILVCRDDGAKADYVTRSSNGESLWSSPFSSGVVELAKLDGFEIVRKKPHRKRVERLGS